MARSTLVLLALLPLLQKGKAKDLVAFPFVDFSAALAKADTAVVIGRLGKVSEGRRERMKDDEGDLTEAGGATVKTSGTMFYRVASTARLAVVKPLVGIGKEPALPLAFDVQSARLDRGGNRRHFLVKPRVPCEDGMLGLFVLQKDKGVWDVAQVVRHEAPADAPPDAEQTFLKRAEDLLLINQRLLDLRAALDDAAFQKERGERKAGAAKLRTALDKRVRMLAEEDLAVLHAQVGPLEKRARELLGELDPDGGR